MPRLLREAPRERDSYGASPLGLFYGTVSLAIFVFASALGIRKKRRTWPIGRVQTWLRAHIWLTILTIPLVAFHSGFRLGGPHTTTVMVLYAIVMVSGFFGLAMQNFMPRLMKDSLSREVVFDQIGEMHRRIVEAALVFRRSLSGQRVAAGAHGAEDEVTTMVAVDDSEGVLLTFLDQECMPYLQASRSRAVRSRLGAKRLSDDVFRLLRLNVSENYRGKVDEMQRWCDDRRVMDAQMRLQHWLHGWLLIHVPLSFSLLIFTFWHAYVTWIYL